MWRVRQSFLLTATDATHLIRCWRCMSRTDEAKEGQPPPCRLSEIYDDALPEVYAYVRARCSSTEIAEELTSATFVQAALEWSRDRPTEISTGWLITVARNKLIDHWRHLAVVDRSLTLLETTTQHAEDPWNTVLDQTRARHVLAEIAPHYRSALTLSCLLYTSPSPRDQRGSRMPSSA